MTVLMQDYDKRLVTEESEQRTLPGKNANSRAAISIVSVSKTYKMKTGKILKSIGEISIQVKEGEFLAIVGPSGCGKSTLLKIVAGLVAPSSGEVCVFDRKVAAPIRDVGFVFQSPLLMPWRKIIENILLPIELLHLDTSSFRKRAKALIETVGLKGFEESYPNELSLGMQQRASIARALIHDPPLLLMDEPFSALDEMTREQMGNELLRITEGLGKTVVFVTHSVPEAVLVADRVAVLSPRPSTVKSILNVGLPSPRSPRMRRSDEYVRCCEEIRELLGLG